ncbi:hypothetical protein AWENTII_007399 [Aspergillus wentii]
MRFLKFALLACQLVLPVLAQDATNSSAIFQLSSDPEFAFVLETVMSLANNYGAQTGEVLRAASQITPGDFESWYDQFVYLGDAIHDKATAINASRFPVSAREAYFRSSSYYRYAPFFLHGNQSDPRINKIGALAAQRGNAKLPTLVLNEGYDAAQEDVYHELGLEILNRGWNVITYEGPGQPTVLRDQKLGFIPDWWNVLSPVIDYLETRDDVDMDHVATVGVSFGGQLTPLAATREHRLSAVICVDGMTDMHAIFAAELGATTIALYNNGSYAEFDKLILAAARSSSTPTSARWALDQSLFSFNTTSPSVWWGRLAEFTINSTMLANISCPVFVGEGENDSLGGQAVKMARTLGNKATYNLFRTDVGAGEHCQLGAEAQLAQVTMDWLDETWEHVALPKNLTNVVY